MKIFLAYMAVPPDLEWEKGDLVLVLQAYLFQRCLLKKNRQSLKT
jgi:hypothetical protein